MGTCIGLRNIRYFVCFLLYTSLHAFITAFISLLYLIFRSKGIVDNIFDSSGVENEDKQDDDDEEDVSPFMGTVHIINGVCLIYSFAFFLMLFCFGASMHA